MIPLTKYLFIFFLLTAMIACKKEKPAPEKPAPCAASGSISQEISNAGFENWDTTNIPQNWSTKSVVGINQSTDSYSGNYAAVIWTWYG